MEKSIHKNFRDGLSFSSQVSRACLFCKWKISSHTFPVVRFIIPQVKIPFPSQSKDDGREEGRIISMLLFLWGAERL